LSLVTSAPTKSIVGDDVRSFILEKGNPGRATLPPTSPLLCAIIWGWNPMAAGGWVRENCAIMVINTRLFESFCEMLEQIPIKAVVRAAEAERRMVEDDLAKKRTEADSNVASVLSFCNFLTLAARGIFFALPILPIEHCAFYRKMVQRLVEAGELPVEMKQRFDLAFSESLATALTSPSLEEFFDGEHAGHIESQNVLN